MAGDDALKQRVGILTQAVASGKTLKPEHQAEYDNYLRMGLVGSAAGKATDIDEDSAAATLLIKQVHDLTTHPGFEASVGMRLPIYGSGMIPGTDPADFRARFEQIHGKQFMEAYKALKGGGQITEIEGQKGESAISRMQTSQSEAEFKAAADEFINTVLDAINRGRKRAGRAPLTLQEAISGTVPGSSTGATPPSGGTTPPGDGGSPRPIGVHDAIDQAAGVGDVGPARVEIGDATSAQTPEFRAGLAKLLADPKVSGDEIRAYWDKNAPGWAANEKNATPPPAAPLAVERGKGGFVEGADAAIRGAADVASFGMADELAAAGRTVFGSGTMAENLRRERAVDRYDEANSPWLRGIGQLAGAVALPIGAGARGAVETAKVGGVMGALYGAGSGGTLGERFTGAAKGGFAGAAGGLALGKLSDIYVNRAAARAARGPTRAEQATDLSNASRDLGIDLMPADAGGPTSRLLTTAFGSTPGGVQPITSAARRVQRQSGEALDRMATSEGPILTKEAAGEAAREGALKYRSGSRASIGRQYDRAAELAGDARIAPRAAMDTLDRNIADLSEVPGGTDGLKVLTDLRDELAQRGTVSVQGIRGMRTQLRQKFMKEGLRGSDIERRVNDVIDAASGDLVSSLEAAGKTGAAKAYADADAAWSARIKTLDDVIMPIIGKKGERSGEQVADALNAAAKGNNARLSKFFDILPEEEAGATRATLINQLGQANPGAQGAQGGEFSLDTFLTRWNQIGPSAKNTFFRGENRKSIDQLATIAENAKAANRFRNHSNTGLVGMTAATGASIGAGIMTLGKVLVGQYVGGRLLASPHVARAMLSIAKAKTPAAAQARVASLSNIATRDPTIRNEVLQLQQRLMSAMNENAPRAAAASGNGQEQNQQ